MNKKSSTRIVSPYRNKKSSANPAVIQQKELSAQNVENQINEDYQPGGLESQINEGEYDSADQNMLEDGTETVWFAYDSADQNMLEDGTETQSSSQMDGGNEGEYDQSDSAEDQNMPEDGTETQSSSQMDGGNEERIPEGGSELESQSVLSGEPEIPERMEIVEGENGRNPEELETQPAASTSPFLSGETERPNGMDMDESVESVDVNVQVSQEQRDYHAQVVNHATGMDIDEDVENVDNNAQVLQAQGDHPVQVENSVSNNPSRDVGSASIGAVENTTYRNTNGNDIEVASATDAESTLDVENAISDSDLGVPQGLTIEDVTGNLDVSNENPELEDLEQPGTSGTDPQHSNYPRYLEPPGSVVVEDNDFGRYLPFATGVRDARLGIDSPQISGPSIEHSAQALYFDTVGSSEAELEKFKSKLSGRESHPDVRHGVGSALIKKTNKKSNPYKTELVEKDLVSLVIKNQGRRYDILYNTQHFVYLEQEGEVMYYPGFAASCSGKVFKSCHSLIYHKKYANPECYTSCSKTMSDQRDVQDHMVGTHILVRCPICTSYFDNIHHHLADVHNMATTLGAPNENLKDELNTPFQYEEDKVKKTQCPAVDYAGLNKTFPGVLYSVRLLGLQPLLESNTFTKLRDRFAQSDPSVGIQFMEQPAFVTDEDKFQALVRFCEFLNGLKKEDLRKLQSFRTYCMRILRKVTIPRCSPSSVKCQGLYPLTMSNLTRLVIAQASTLNVYGGIAHNEACGKVTGPCEKLVNSLILVVPTEVSKKFLQLLLPISSLIEVRQCSSWGRGRPALELLDAVYKINPKTKKEVLDSKMNIYSFMNHSVIPLVDNLKKSLFNLNETGSENDLYNTLDAESSTYNLLTECIYYSMVKDCIMKNEILAVEPQPFNLNILYTDFLKSLLLNRSKYMEFLPYLALNMITFEIRTKNPNGVRLDKFRTHLLGRYNSKQICFYLLKYLKGSQ